MQCVIANVRSFRHNTTTRRTYRPTYREKVLSRSGSILRIFGLHNPSPPPPVPSPPLPKASDKPDLNGDDLRRLCTYHYETVKTTDTPIRVKSPALPQHWVCLIGVCLMETVCGISAGGERMRFTESHSDCADDAVVTGVGSKIMLRYGR